MFDIATSCLFFGVFLLLIAATVAVLTLRRYVDYGVDPAVLDTFRTRIRVWWLLFGFLTCVFAIGPLATIFFFFILSWGVLREYITLTPKSPVDHRALFWIYIFFTPLQFILIGVNPEWFLELTGITPYRVFSVLLPGYVFLVLPGFMAVSGDPKRFLERIAKLQLGLIICVYALSYAPALLTMDLPNNLTSTMPAEESPTSGMLNEGIEKTVIESIAPPKNLPMLPERSGPHFRLLLFFVLLVQFGDIFQYLWSQVSRHHVVAENINATRTWEGVLGGAVTTALLGVALWYYTPFR